GRWGTGGTGRRGGPAAPRRWCRAGRAAGVAHRTAVGPGGPHVVTARPAPRRAGRDHRRATPHRIDRRPREGARWGTALTGRPPVTADAVRPSRAAGGQGALRRGRPVDAAALRPPAAGTPAAAPARGRPDPGHREPRAARR